VLAGVSTGASASCPDGPQAKGRRPHSAGMDRPTITFDDEGRIRVLDPAKFAKAEQLEKECGEFSDSEPPARWPNGELRAV